MSVSEIVLSMTIDEKIKLLTGYGVMETYPIERLGVKSVKFADGPHGVRIDEDANCVSFPNLCNVGATWDRKLVYQMGEALAKECIENDVQMLLAPGINIKRHILCGRNFEYFSEDPILAGELGAAYIQGLQVHGVGTSLKHFAANNQEQYRDCISVNVDERTLREIYLKPFEIAVKKGKPTSVMCAYNKLHAVWCSENPFLLTEVLRNEWGYEGFVVSDWGAVHDSCKAIRAGLDLRMPNHTEMAKDIKQGLENGEITEKEIDEAVERILTFVLQSKPQKQFYDRTSQHKKAKEIARDGIVLLKNEDKVLPLNNSKYKKISVIGEFAESPLISGQGSAEVNVKKECIDNPLNALRNALTDVEIQYREYYNKKPENSAVTLWLKLQDFSDFVQDSDVIVMFVGSMLSEDTEIFDRTHAQLNPNCVKFIEAASKMGKKVIVVIQSGSAIILGEWRDKVDAIVEMWLGGESAGTAIAEILSGIVNPSGKLPETFPKVMRNDLDYPGDGVQVHYREGYEVGYRYYDKHPDEIVYPFGHGLSYTEFKYSNIIVKHEGNEVKISFELENVGDYDGAEVTQIYVSDLVANVDRPVKELKSFEKTFLKAGEKKTVNVRIPISELAYYNVLLRKWIVEKGTYEILVGASSQDIRLKEKMYIDVHTPYTMEQYGESMIG